MGRMEPFSIRFVVALLFAIDVCGGSTSIIALSAPTRGNDTFSNDGKLFFSAKRWLTSRRFRKNPPSGNRTIHRRSKGINESRKCCRKFSMVASRVFRP